MTLSMTLGMTIGVRRALWMMPGELLGVAIVAAASIIGVAALVLQYPTVFIIVKTLGGLYLFYLGVQLWLSKGKMALQADQPANNAIRGLFRFRDSSLLLPTPRDGYSALPCSPRLSIRTGHS